MTASRPAVTSSGYTRARVTVPQIEPAPACLPDTKTRVTLYIKGVNRGFVCKVVRVDNKSRQILLTLPDDARNLPQFGPRAKTAIGWADHSKWHESAAAITSSREPKVKFVWFKIASTPVHRERRRYVRAKEMRPVSIHAGRHQVNARTMDLSEAAVRVKSDFREPIYTGEKVHVMFRTHHRFRGEMVPIAIDGTVYCTREIGEGHAGHREAVILFENLAPAQEDFIRGIVFDHHLQDKKPVGVRD